MAAGPADAFSATPRGFGCYDRELISAAADNLWSSSVVATASTGASWVDEVHNSDPIEKRIEDIKRKFHRGRVLQIKHLPREITEEEVRELLGEWDVQTVTIQSGSARVSLCAPEVLEDWDRNAAFTVRGQRVTIVPSPTEMLLCVGRLPIAYTESQFTSLVSTYGEVRRSFLMISERTGDSKGYGFVEYVTKEAALQAKNALDGKRIVDFTAVCDWLDSSHVTIRSLHSKCLYVDQLPPNYRDMGEFRRVFSTIVNPPYCQIALRNGCPQDWGLVEFTNEDDAEKTQQTLDGHVLHGQRIRVAYYIPGVRAINLYLKLLNDGGTNKGKSALLPDPPAPAVFQQLQSLAKQNPVFAQNLQTIIMQQIQDLQKGKGASGVGDQNKRPGYQKGPMPHSPYGPPQVGPGPGGNPNLVKNAQQTALTLLLASQMQQHQQQQQNGGGQGGLGNNGSGSGQMSPNSPNSMNAASSLQNQQLLAALQAMSKGGGSNGSCGNDQYLSGIPGMNSGGGNLLGLGTPGLSSQQQLDQQQSNGIPQGFFSSHGGLLSPGCSSQTSNGSNNGSTKDDQWSAFKSGNRSSSSSYGSNGMHKTPLLPSPSGLSSPSLDVPMDTGMTTPKTPPGDPLQAVWYSLFGQSTSSDSGANSPGTTSPHFMKTPMNSSTGSPIGRSADALFGVNPYQHHQQQQQQQQQHHQHMNNKSSPPGFCTPNGMGGVGGPLSHRGGNPGGMNGDLQEALNSLLSNPQSLSHIFGNNNLQCMGNDAMSPPPPFGNHLQQQQHHHNGHGLLQQQHHMQQQHHQLHRQNSFSSGLDQNSGVPNALLDLLMQSMKGDSPHNDGYGGLKGQSGGGWSSGGMSSNPPSPIGNNRPFNNGLHHQGMGVQPQRSGSNGSSEMSSSSPRSPSYSPFSRNSSKGLLESGNGSASPTPTWSNNTVLGSPPHSGGYLGAPQQQQHQPPHHHPQLHTNSFTSQSRNIWAAPSVSPGATSLSSGGSSNNNSLMNPLGIKRKVNHESAGSEIDGFIPGAPHGHNQSNPNHHHASSGMTGGGVGSSLSSGHNNGGGGGSGNGHGSHHQSLHHPGNNSANPHHSGGNSGHNNDPLSGHYADSYFKKKKKN